MDVKRIESIYSQLTGNIDSYSIQSKNEIDTDFSAKASYEILRLFGTELAGELNIGKGKSTISSISYKREIEDKFLEVIDRINEKNYKDIFCLIEKYMKKADRIITVGKGTFLVLQTSGEKEPKEIADVEFP